MKSIKTLERISVKRLAEIRGGSEPVKLSNVIFERGFGHWNKDYFCQTVGSEPVQLVTSRSRRFDYNDMNQNGIVIEEIPFAEALEKIYAEAGKEGCHYMQQCPVRKRLPGLMADLSELSELFARRFHLLVNLWVGQTGAVSPLHFDQHDNFLHQVAGRKKLYLYAPEDTECLYPNTEADMSHVSRVDLHNVDTEAFPRFAAAECFEVELGPGDMLYMPKRWWHQVETLETGISVNYWYQKRPLWHALVRPFVARTARA